MRNINTHLLVTRTKPVFALFLGLVILCSCEKNDSRAITNNSSRIKSKPDNMTNISGTWSLEMTRTLVRGSNGLIISEDSSETNVHTGNDMQFNTSGFKINDVTVHYEISSDHKQSYLEYSLLGTSYKLKLSKINDNIFSLSKDEQLGSNTKITSFYFNKNL